MSSFARFSKIKGPTESPRAWLYIPKWVPSIPLHTCQQLQLQKIPKLVRGIWTYLWYELMFSLSTTVAKKHPVKSNQNLKTLGGTRLSGSLRSTWHCWLRISTLFFDWTISSWPFGQKTWFALSRQNFIQSNERDRIRNSNFWRWETVPYVLEFTRNESLAVTYSVLDAIFGQVKIHPCFWTHFWRVFSWFPSTWVMLYMPTQRDTIVYYICHTNQLIIGPK